MVTTTACTGRSAQEIIKDRRTIQDRRKHDWNLIKKQRSNNNNNNNNNKRGELRIIHYTEMK